MHLTLPQMSVSQLVVELVMYVLLILIVLKNLLYVVLVSEMMKNPAL